ncbi:MAG: hypothetical protein ACRDI3_05995 [Actinomycetota bacterium]
MHTELILGAYVTLLTSGLASLLWVRLNRLEGLISEMATKEDLAELRREVNALRSDLTQVALAVGAHRPHASGT